MRRATIGLLLLAAALLLATAPSRGEAKGGAPAAASRAAGKGAGGKRRIGSLSGLQPGAAAPFAARAAALRPLDGAGTVRTVQRGRAWLDAGALDGLRVGQVVTLKRKGEPAGSCTVELLADRNATCTGPGMRPGDTFPVNPRAAGSLPVSLPPLLTPAEEARRFAASQAVAFVPVDFKSTRVVERLDRLRRDDVGYAHFAWLSSDAQAVHQEQVHAQSHGAEVWRGARLDLDLTAMARSAASPTERFEPGRKAQLWVREASLSFAEPGSRYRFAAGRVLPWLLPGGATFDGIQAGWRPGRGAELGLFGGAVPDPLTTAPGTDRATGGAYWAVDGVAGESTQLRNEGRVAWVRLPGSKSRIEAETTAQAWIARRLDVALQARLGAGDYAAPGKLDAARADLGWFQPGLLSFYGGFRYDDSRLPDVAAPALGPGRTRQATASFSWDRMGWLVLRATGGTGRDLDSGLSHTWAGPEVAAPRILGRLGGASAGYAEELGSYAGRNAWLQGDLTFGPRTRLLTRVSWMMDGRPSPLAAEQSAGLSLAAVSDLAPWLRFRLTALGRVEIPQGPGAPTGWGGSLMAGLEGRY